MQNVHGVEIDCHDVGCESDKELEELIAACRVTDTQDVLVLKDGPQAIPIERHDYLGGLRNVFPGFSYCERKAEAKRKLAGIRARIEEGEWLNVHFRAFELADYAWRRHITANKTNALGSSGDRTNADKGVIGD